MAPQVKVDALQAQGVQPPARQSGKLRPTAPAGGMPRGLAAAPLVVNRTVIALSGEGGKWMW